MQVLVNTHVAAVIGSYIDKRGRSIVFASLKPVTVPSPTICRRLVEEEARRTRSRCDRSEPCRVDGISPEAVVRPSTINVRLTKVFSEITNKREREREIRSDGP